MLFFFPYRIENHDGRVPWATIALIVANVAVFAIAPSAEDEGLRRWMLVYGEIDPVQWFTSLFLHADFMQLLGNMAFLWSFGLVIEGLCGAVALLAAYLLSGVLGGAFVQVLSVVTTWSGPMDEVPRAALGASGAVFEVFELGLGGFDLGSALAHLAGAGAGLLMAWSMMLLGAVDTGEFHLFGKRARSRPAWRDARW